MKLLWIEDHQSDRKITYFAPIYKRHDIKIITDFTESLNTIKKDLNTFDWVVLDIDLTNSEFTQEIKDLSGIFGITAEEFLKKAGMRLLIELIQLGFPEQRIRFLTANTDPVGVRYYLRELQRAWPDKDILKRIVDRFCCSNEIKNKREEKEVKEGVDRAIESNTFDIIWEIRKFSQLRDEFTTNTYEEFNKIFTSSLLLPPQAYYKNNIDEFHIWLKSSLIDEPNKYLKLRRGFLEASTILSEMLEKEGSKALKFNAFVSADQSITIEDGLDYLHSLTQIFSIREPSVDSAERFIRHLLRTLSHPWERAQPNSYREKCFAPEYIDKLSNCYLPYRQFGKIAKITRNLFAHNNLKITDFDDVAFLALILLRAFFSLPNCLMSFEKEFLSVFNIHESKKIPAKSLRSKYQRTIKKILEIDEPNNLDLFSSFDDLKFDKPNYLWLYLLYWETFFPIQKNIHIIPNYQNFETDFDLLKGTFLRLF